MDRLIWLASFLPIDQVLVLLFVKRGRVYVRCCLWSGGLTLALGVGLDPTRLIGYILPFYAHVHKENGTQRNGWRSTDTRYDQDPL